MQTPQLWSPVIFQVVVCVSVSWLHWMQSKGHKVKGKKRVFTHRRRTKLFPSFRKILRQYVTSSGRYYGAFVVAEKSDCACLESY